MRGGDENLTALRSLCEARGEAGMPGTFTPVAGDYAIYQGADDHKAHIAFAVSPTDMVIVPPDDTHGLRLPLAALIPTVQHEPGEPRYGDNTAVMLCRLPAHVWPGGDDVSVGPSAGERVAIVDAGDIAAQHQWVAAHPVDAHTPLQHLLRVGAFFLVNEVLSAFGTAVETLLGLSSDAMTKAMELLAALLRLLGVPGLLVLAVAGAVGWLIGRSFDGRRLHQWLTGLVLCGMSLTFGWMPGYWRVLLGLARGDTPDQVDAEAGGGAAGMLLRVLVHGTSLGVDMLTGVEYNSNVQVGWVGFALLSDVLVVGKVLIPLKFAARLAVETAPRALRLLPVALRLPVQLRVGQVGRLLAALAPEASGVARWVIGTASPRTLDIAAHAGDLMALKPSTVLHDTAVIRGRGATLLHHFGVGRRSAELRAMTATGPRISGVERIARVLRWRPETVRVFGVRGLNAVSWTWRPGAAVHDIAEDTGRFAELLRHDLTARTWRSGWAHRVHAALTPIHRAVARHVAEGSLTTVGDGAERFGRLTGLRSGAHTLTGLSSGHGPAGPQVWMPPAPPSPGAVPVRLDGLPVPSKSGGAPGVTERAAALRALAARHQATLGPRG